MARLNVTPGRLVASLALAGSLLSAGCLSHEGPTVPKKPPEPDGGGKVIVPSRDSLRPTASSVAQSFSHRNTL